MRSRMHIRCHHLDMNRSIIIFMTIISSVMVVIQMLNYSSYIRKTKALLGYGNPHKYNVLTRKNGELAFVYSNDVAENTTDQNKEYLMNMYLLHSSPNDSSLIPEGIFKSSREMDTSDGNNMPSASYKNEHRANIGIAPKSDIKDYTKNNAGKQKTNHKNACPIIQYSAACNISVEASPWPVEGGGAPGTRPGYIQVNGEHLLQWTVAPTFAVVLIDENCRLLDTVIFENATSNGIGSNGSEWWHFAEYFNSLPDWSRVICVGYGRSRHFRMLVDLGVDRQNLYNLDQTAGMVTLATDKRYPGRIQYNLTPRGMTVNNLTLQFYRGQPFEYTKYYETYSMVLARHLSTMKAGGFSTPIHCNPRWRIAVIVPYRRRIEHLYVFVDNMIRFLQQQKIAFNIFVIEQADPELFNRAALMNIGFLEARKVMNFDCYVFQDVDLVPEDLTNTYACAPQPRHLVVSRSATDYKVARDNYFGGGIIMTPDLIERINGFPNRMFGWGGEDDEIYARMTGIYEEVERRGVWHDGLNTTAHTLLAVERRPVYTHVFAKIPGPKTKEEAMIQEPVETSSEDV